LTDSDITVLDEALRKIVSGYTREAGVRNLEREIGTVCRKVARQIAESAPATPPTTDAPTESTTDNAAPAATTENAARPSSAVIVTPENVDVFLGPQKFQAEMGGREAQVGVTTGMAWTPVGGEVLFIETAKLPGKRGLTLTGQLGDVMKESASIALDYLRSHAELVGIPADFTDDFDIHVHVPAGAIPKDGPSAGVAITTALASLMSGRPARHDIAMTGEVTLTGRVLPIGGIKEKVLAARQAGIKNILLPERNRADVRDIPEEARGELTIDFVDDVRDAIEKVLLPIGTGTGAGITGAGINGHAKAPSDVTTPLEQDSDTLVS
ncbi:MAG TPA: S16 family serine protease, partial [Abditibacteriaceae bacterium]